MLELDIPEAKFILDENEKVKVVEPREQNDAHKLIENFMVLANEVVAKHYCVKKYPFVYRVHEKPTREKMDNFNYYLSSLGVATPEIIGDVEPDYVQEILELLKGKPFEQICNKVLLRSMQKRPHSLPDRVLNQYRQAGFSLLRAVHRQQRRSKRKVHQNLHH